MPRRVLPRPKFASEKFVSLLTTQLQRQTSMRYTRNIRAYGLARRPYGPSNPKWYNPQQASVNTAGFEAAAVVVGAGPAGLAAVGTLLENLPQEAGKIFWIDPEFDAGKLSKYQEVPSNTKAGLFGDYAQAVKIFRKMHGNRRPNAITAIQNLPAQDTCSLRYARDMVRFLTHGVQRHWRVMWRVGFSTRSEWEEHSSKWRLSCFDFGSKQSFRVTTPLVVYCTGSFPKKIELPQTASESAKNTPELISITTALTPITLLNSALDPAKDIRVGVIGSSHSAVLVLMNLVRLAQSTHPKLRVIWFSRSPHFKYAEQKDGWILYDNTGLKGEAAQFAKAELDGDNLGSSESGKIIQRVDCSGGDEAEKEAISTWAPSCDYIVPAIGFQPVPLPKIRGASTVVFNHETGGFEDDAGKPILGIFGAGIAYPEKVTDPAGNTEYAVGLWKFMTFLKRVVPQWVRATHPTWNPLGLSGKRLRQARQEERLRQQDEKLRQKVEKRLEQIENPHREAKKPGAS